MKNVQVRNVPERVHKVLRRRAAEAGQSLQEYLLHLLEESAGSPNVQELFDRVAKESGGRIGLEEAARILREDRESH